MRLPVPLFLVARTPLALPHPQVRRWRRMPCLEETPSSSRLPPSRDILLSHATRDALSSQRNEHGGPTPAHPSLGSTVRYLQYLRYLPVGEPLHVPQDQCCPVLRAHVRERSLYLIAPLRTQRRCLGVCLPSAGLREVRCLAAVFPLPPAYLPLADVEAGVDGDSVEPGAKGALTPEASDISPDPDPDLLACVLGSLVAQHSQCYSIYKTRMSPNQFREGLDVASSGAGSEVSVVGSAVLSTHPEVAPVDAKLTID